MKTLTVLWKCACLPAEWPLEVRARGGNDDVADWMRDVVTLEVSLDHQRRSPFCRRPALEYLKIAVPADGRPIGASPRDAN